MQRQEVSCAVRRTYTSLGAEGLTRVRDELIIVFSFSNIGQLVVQILRGKYTAAESKCGLKIEMVVWFFSFKYKNVPW